MKGLSSLVANLYKITAKILSLQLKEVLQNTIWVAQDAFVKNTQIPLFFFG